MDAQGFVHVYTGNGKGKTTAALGMAVRAVGAGWKVYLAQFLKGPRCSELQSLASFPNAITVRQFGQTYWDQGRSPHDPRNQAQHALTECVLAECQEALNSEQFELVILDEVNVAAAVGLVQVDDLVRLIDQKPRHVELVLTGRWADEQIVRRADLVTNMQEVKHYYQRGVSARAGVET